MRRLLVILGMITLLVAIACSANDGFSDELLASKSVAAPDDGRFSRLAVEAATPAAAASAPMELAAEMASDTQVFTEAESVSSQGAAEDLEAAERILQRVTAPEVSDFYTRIHREQGVTIHTGVSVTAITGEGRAQAVLCADGSMFDADLVIIGVGVVPNIELALDAGLQVDNGIVIDEYCRTSAPEIVAIGDCANAFNPIYQRRMRLESVPNANEQAKIASATLCGLQRTSKSLPWFWSDQYDLKLQIAGLSQGYDQIVIRGDVQQRRSFAAFYLQAGRLIAADCVNRPQEFMLSKKLITAGTAVDPLRLADESIAVQALMG